MQSRVHANRSMPVISRSAAADVVNRKCAHCEAEEKLQRKESGSDNMPVTNSFEGSRLMAHELTTNVTGLIQREDNVGDDEKGGGVEEPTPVDEKDAGTKTKAKPKTNPCTRRILAEGTCKELALGSKWLCCDPDKGFKREGRKTSPAEEGKTCTSEKWTPIFTCDKKCDKALEKGCDDNDNWMALPPDKFALSKCDDQYIICANGKQTTGYVRDRSSSEISYEVSPGIQKALGVKVGDTFMGSVYRPGANQATIDKDACCKEP